MMQSKSMRAIPTTALLIATAFALGACGPVNRGLESVNQPVVQRTDFVYDLDSPALSPNDRQRLIAWFDALHLGYGDSVSIDDRSGSGASHDAIADVVGRYGLLLSDTAPVTGGSNEVRGVRVVVSRSEAKVDKCPNWDRKAELEFAGSTMSNFGCAVNTNLAAMVANPADLVHGAEAGGPDAWTITRAIKTYREKEPTGKNDLKEESTGGNSGSSGGN